MIALAVDGGYLLAALSESPGGHGRRRAPAARPPCTTRPSSSWWGCGAQAKAQASEWSRETRILTDRMWPGPLTVIVPSEALAADGSGEGVVRITMPASRTSCAVPGLRTGGGPGARTPRRSAARRPGGRRPRSSWQRHRAVVDGGTCRGPGPTVVDCTASRPGVRHVGGVSRELRRCGVDHGQPARPLAHQEGGTRRGVAVLGPAWELGRLHGHARSRSARITPALPSRRS